MLKSELLDKLKDIADDADINETIQGIEGLAKPFDVANATVEDYKNMLANNEVVKAYYQSSFDSAVGSAVTKHDEKFKKEKLPKLIEEAVKAKTNEGLTPEQKQLKELQTKLDAMEAEKAKNELIKTNADKLRNKGLDTGLAKYIQDDEDIEYFEKLISSNVENVYKNSSPKPESSAGREKEDPFIKAFMEN